jgi:hypothetical protein
MNMINKLGIIEEPITITGMTKMLELPASPPVSVQLAGPKPTLITPAEDMAAGQEFRQLQELARRQIYKGGAIRE